MGEIAAGVKISVDVKDEAFREGLTKLERKARYGLYPAFDEISSRLLVSTQRRFELAQEPDGSPWEPLSPVTLALREKRKQSGPPLLVHGDLYRSYTRRADARSAEAGSNWPYARIHQLGGQAGRGRKTTIPARPVLGLSDKDAEAIVNIIQRYLAQ